MLESKKDDFGNCYIDFEIFESNGAMAVNEQSEKQECQTYGVKNQLIFGPDWSAWEGWVQFSETKILKDWLLSDPPIARFQLVRDFQVTFCTFLV